MKHFSKRAGLVVALLLVASTLNGCAFVGVIIEAIAGLAGGAAGGAVSEGIGGAIGSQAGGMVGSAVSSAVVQKGTSLLNEEPQNSGTSECTDVCAGDEN